MTTTATGGKGALVLMALGGGLLLLTAGKKKASAATAQAPAALPEPIEPPTSQLPIEPDDDDIPAAPQQSPGWPQPQQPVSLPLPVPTAPVPIAIPQVPAVTAPQVPVNLPVPVLPVPIPTSIPAPVTLDQDEDDDQPPTPANVPVPPIVVPPRPPQHPAEQPSTVAEDTALMVQRLLAAEAKPNWKTKDPVVLAWQKARGLVADGQFGPKTALIVADEMGTVPLVRFWPKNTYPGDGTLQNYQAELLAKANTAPTPRKEQLRAAADREQGQGYARNVKAAEALITLEAV